MNLSLPHSTDSETRAALSRVAEALRRVPRFAIAEGVTANPANAAFSVRHNLGVVPQAFFWSADDSLELYATTDDRKAWDDTFITLQGSKADVHFTLVVMGDL